MSKIEVNQIDTISGSSTLLVGPSAATKLTFSSTLTVDFNVNSPGVTLGSTMKNVPIFYVLMDSGQSIPDSTVTKLTFDTEIYDSDNAFSSGLFTVPSNKAGKYFFSFTSGVNTAIACEVVLQISKNGQTSLTSNAGDILGNVEYHTGTVGQTHFNISGTFDLSVGDTVQANMWQNAGGAKNTTTDGRCYFTGYKLIGA